MAPAKAFIPDSVPEAYNLRMRAVYIATALVLAALAAPHGAGAALAQGVDHERARAAMERGEIMPLHAILVRVDEQFQGRVIEVRLTDLEAGLQGWIYALTLLTPQNNVLMLKVDAGTGVLLQVVGQGIEEARKPARADNGEETAGP